jgi:hypothetical protein
MVKKIMSIILRKKERKKEMKNGLKSIDDYIQRPFKISYK